MNSQKAQYMLLSIADILEHAHNVQDGVSLLLERSAFSFHQFLEERGLSADEHVLNAYQHQDVMKQQLSALNDAVLIAKESIRAYAQHSKTNEVIFYDNIDKLLHELQELLTIAKKQQEDFSGNSLDKKHHKEIEFF